MQSWKAILVAAASCAAAACSGSDGEDGLSTLVATEDEAPGENCPLGGIGLSTGGDDNGNGVLDSDEIESTRYVCNGSGTIIAEESVSSEEFDDNIHIAQDGEAKTLLSASLMAPAAGTVFVIGRAGAFCSSTQAGYQCAEENPAADACLGVSTESGTNACAIFDPDHAFAYLQADITLEMTHSNSFEVEAGEFTAYLHGSTTSSTSTGAVGFFGAQLTLIYAPEL